MLIVLIFNDYLKLIDHIFMKNVEQNFIHLFMYSPGIFLDIHVLNFKKSIS